MFTKIARSIALLAFTALCLTGCFPTGERTVTGNAEYAKLKERADKINNFKLELRLPENTPESVPTVKLTVKQFNVDDIYSTFAEGGSVISSEEYPGNYFANEVYHVDKLDSEITLMYESGSISMNRYLKADDSSAAYQKHCAYDYLSQVMDNYFFDDPRLNSDLPGFTREDALKKANEVFDKLGIKIYSDPQIFALSTQIANDLVSEYTWDDGLEAYYLNYPAVIENIPTLSKRADINFFLFSAIKPIRMVITKDRVEIFSGSYIFDNDYEKTGETPIKFNAAEALNVLVSYYEPQKLTNEIGFTSCELVYVPTELLKDTKSVVFKPAWLFSGYKKTDYIGTLNICQLVYADTGTRAVTD